MKEELKVKVKSFMNGDLSAYEHIYKEEYAKVYARVKLNIRFNSEKDIEDVVQDTFIKAYEKIDTLKDVNNFESWLMMIAINTAKNEIIKRNKTTFFEEIPNMEGITQEDLLENTYSEFQPEREMARKELEENLMDILSQIPPQQSMCLQMKEYDGLSYQEIADTLEIPLSSVKNNIFYAKKKIKAEVEARKLYSVAPITFFLWMYHTYVEAAELSAEGLNAAWSVQQGLLSGLTQRTVVGASASVDVVTEITATEVAKATGKMTLGKMAAVIGTVAILAIAGIGIANKTDISDAEKKQEEIELKEEEDTNHLEDQAVQEEEKSDISDNNKVESVEMSIENVYVGSSLDASEELYSINGVKHFRTDQPVIHYTVAGYEYDIEYEGAYIDGYGYEMGYELADITGDGENDLIVSVYCIGNTLCETLQDTYIYSINYENRNLDEIYRIVSDSGEMYDPGYPYNIGVYSEEGGIRLDLCNGEIIEESKTVHIEYQDSKWMVTSVNTFEGWEYD